MDVPVYAKETKTRKKVTQLERGPIREYLQCLVHGTRTLNRYRHSTPGISTPGQRSHASAGLGTRQAIVRSIIGCSTEDGRFSLNGASRADFDAVSRSPYPRTETLGA